MTLLPLPVESNARWRRLDAPGFEEASIRRTATGWELTGHCEIEEEGVAAKLSYIIATDERWLTRFASVSGIKNGMSVSFDLALTAAGEWTCNGTPVTILAGAADIDLAFTPATNILPIRRLQLAVGESAPVESAWLRFPELRLERLSQTYTREAEHSFRYHAVVDGELFTARLETDAFGKVLLYEGLWQMEEGYTDPAFLKDTL